MVRKTIFFLSALLAAHGLTFGAATIGILVLDDPGVGFNDPAPAAPVGGNPGTTLGAQRLNVFRKAADTWGATLDSSVEIVVGAVWPVLPCTATQAVLGSAGPVSLHANFPNAPVNNYWYPQALANKLAGVDLAPLPDIVAQFNRNLGQTGCFTGIFFYYGLDGVAPAGTVNLLPVLLHELAHGLGFLTSTNASTGGFLAGLPNIADRYLFDTAAGATWDVLTPAQRASSAINNNGQLRWSGPRVMSDAPAVLNKNVEVAVTAPTASATVYLAAPNDGFGLSLNTNQISGELMPVVSIAGGGNACATLNASDALAVSGKIALIDRGGCGFTVKVKNAQNAGAIGVILANTSNRFPLEHMTGIDPTIVIPATMLRLNDGNALDQMLRFRSRTRSGVFVTLRGSATLLGGADAFSRPYMYTPNPLEQGSSVSHWDISLSRNQLMEPFNTPTLTLSVTTPQDLTFSFFKDIGW